MTGGADRRHDAAEDARSLKCGRALTRLTYVMETVGSDGYEYKGFSVRAPTAEKPDWLATVRALDGEGAPVVAFVGGADLGDMFLNLVGRLSNGSLKWREDQFGR